jgi:RNA polymerase sigma-70 factor (ECF subfamily)
MDSLAASGELDGYHHLSAARAELLLRDGRYEEAEHLYRRAIAECANAAERRYLERRLATVRSQPFDTRR